MQLATVGVGSLRSLTFDLQCLRVSPVRWFPWRSLPLSSCPILRRADVLLSAWEATTGDQESDSFQTLISTCPYVKPKKAFWVMSAKPRPRAGVGCAALGQISTHFRALAELPGVFGWWMGERAACRKCQPGPRLSRLWTEPCWHGAQRFLVRWRRLFWKVPLVLWNSQSSQRFLLLLPELTWRYDSRGHQQETILKWPLGFWCEIRYHCCISLKAI